MSLASDYLLDNVIESIINQAPIKKYKDKFDNTIGNVNDWIETLLIYLQMIFSIIKLIIER